MKSLFQPIGFVSNLWCCHIPPSQCNQTSTLSRYLQNTFHSWSKTWKSTGNIMTTICARILHTFTAVFYPFQWLLEWLVCRLLWHNTESLPERTFVHQSQFDWYWSLLAAAWKYAMRHITPQDFLMLVPCVCIYVVDLALDSPFVHLSISL